MLHINRFVDRLRQAETRRQQHVPMTLAEAHDLHADITKLLLALEDLRQRHAQDPGPVTEINVEGGSF